MSNILINSFNALPRKPRAPLGRVPNEWHFDLRYVHIEPTPSHVLMVIHPQLQFIHVERLPFGIPNDRSGIAFFPESGKEAASEVSKTLLHVFVNNLGRSNASGSEGPPAFAPWKLTTKDKTLGAAVGAEFKKLGVRAAELHTIGVSTTSLNGDAQVAFQTHFQSIKSRAGIEEHAASLVSNPEPIVFHNFDIAPPQPTLASLGVTPGGEEPELALLYARRLASSRPHAKEGLPHPGEEMCLVQEMMQRKPESVVKNLADRGDPEASFDYGIRLLIGLGCRYNRSRSRSYLVNALASPLASDELKSTIHSLLIDWYISASRKQVRHRYMFAAAHHANLAVSLGRGVAGLEFPASGEVLGFVRDNLEPFSKKSPEVILF